MITLSAEEIKLATNGTILFGMADAEASCISTDSRNILDSSAFFALAGENFDAHDYLDQVVKSGAEIIVCEKWTFDDSASTVIIQVEDTLKALQDLASYVRAKLEARIVAVTGSNGKTSTKDFINAVISSQFISSATLGNFNNHIGLPLTILATKGNEQAAIWEMGMNHPGEIAPLCEIAHPEIGVITNIGTAHIEYMGSREAIALEKGELAAALPAGGTLILPDSCDFNDQFKQRTQADVLTVGGDTSHVRAEEIKQTANGSEFDLVIGDSLKRVKLPVIGEHMVSNALLAAAVGDTLGIDIEKIANALSNATLTSGRLRVFSSDGIQVIDDTYNANPESMMAALKTLADMNDSGQKIAVLGKLGELGQHESAAYKAIGTYASELKLTVISVGDSAKPISDSSKDNTLSHHFSTNESAAEWLKTHSVAGDTVLFKGSRAAAIEQVMNLTYTP